MDNSAYMPNHLPPPSLVVFSQAGGLPEALRMQRPFNPQVSVLLSLPICLSLCLLLLLKLCLPTRKSGENNICDRTCYSATNSSPRVLLTRVAIRFALWNRLYLLQPIIHTFLHIKKFNCFLENLISTEFFKHLRFCFFFFFFENWAN